MNKQFSEDVKNGLRKLPKTLPSKYFYDEKGDDLFIQIMNLPEYYLTNCELEIFKEKTDEIIKAIGAHTNLSFDLIELGAGDGTKTKHLLSQLVEDNFNFTYHPVDISQNALNRLERTLIHELPSLQIAKQQGDYFNILSKLKSDEKQKIILFLGSNIGNFTDDKASEFIKTASEFMKSGDILLIGADLIKSKEIVLPAYSDSSGVTAEFNLNLLDRINHTFKGTFKRENFTHEATYEADEGIARSFIVSKIDQTVELKDLNLKFEFRENEKINTEVSRKYNDDIVSNIIEGSGLTISSKILDSKGYFADYVLVKN